MAVIDWDGNGIWIPEISFLRNTGQWTVVVSHPVPGVAHRTVTSASLESAMDELTRILRSDLDD